MGNRAKRLIDSLEACPVGDGDLRGELFRVLPYQRRFLRGAFAAGVQRAGLSLARGGGKTGLASALCLDAIRPAGILHREGFECILIASSFAQARLGFEAVLTSLDLMGELAPVPGEGSTEPSGHTAPGERRSAAGWWDQTRNALMGWRVNLVIGDEPSQWGPSGELLAAAIRTALGKRKGARALFLGTRPAC